MSSNAVVYNDPPTGGSARYGWYMDFDLASSPTERVVLTPLFRDGILFFETTIPDATPCSKGGDGWIMAVDANTGGKPPKNIFDVNNDGVIDSGDQVNNDTVSGLKLGVGLPGGIAILGNYLYMTGTNTLTPMKLEVTPIAGPNTGRYSWQELTGQ